MVCARSSPYRLGMEVPVKQRSALQWILILGIVTSAGLVGCASTPEGVLVEDPLGRFTFVASGSLIEQPTDGSYYHYLCREPDTNAFVTARDGATEELALASAVETSGVSLDIYDVVAAAGLGEWRLLGLRNPDNGHQAAVAYQYRGSTAYALTVWSNNPAVVPTSPSSSIMAVLTTFEFSASAGVIFVPSGYEELEEWAARQTEVCGGSVSIAAMRRDEIVYSYATGERFYLTPTSEAVAYHWGSISKLVTATAVMQQVEAGTIDLDDPVTLYIPELATAGDIRIRDLLTHASGLPAREVRATIGYGSVVLPSLEEELASYAPTVARLIFEPGSTHSYNNHNYLLLGIIVERVTGMPFGDYVDESILQPAGMDHAAYRSDDLVVPVAHPILTQAVMSGFVSTMESQGKDPLEMIEAQTDDFVYCREIDILAPWGGIQSPPADALRFAAVYMNRGRAGETRILSARTIRQMWRMQKSASGEPLGIGLGWFIGRDELGTYVEHEGGGPGIDAILRIYPRRDLAVSVMANTNEINASRIADYTAAIAAGSRR